MPSADPRLKTRARKALRLAVARQRRGCEHPDCQHPGIPIDYRPRADGPLAYDLDEIVPRAHGGDPLDPRNVRPTHQHCNRRSGALMTNTGRPTTPPPTSWSSERW